MKSLMSVISSEGQTKVELQQMETALIEEKKFHNGLQVSLAETQAIVDSYHRISILAGKWTRTSKSPLGNEIENIEISNSNMFLYEDNSMNQKYSIHNFSYDKNTSKVSFTLFHFETTNRPQYTFFSFNDLTYRHNGLSGIEYRKKSSVTINYSRPSEPLDKFDETAKVSDTDKEN